jgi:MarR family transcriptional regulator, organic hydroperoxide resistance regulator
MKTIAKDMSGDFVRQVMALYPKIFFACHTRHVRDPKSRRVLSSHQASILDHLDEQEPMPLMDLARHMGVTPSTMSIAIERLVRQGYVLRSRDRKDGRRVSLTLSVSGARVRDSKSVLDPARVRQMLERLGSAEREDAIRGLALLARAAQRFMEQTAPDRQRWATTNRVPGDHARGET